MNYELSYKFDGRKIRAVKVDGTYWFLCADVVHAARYHGSSSSTWRKLVSEHGVNAVRLKKKCVPELKTNGNQYIFDDAGAVTLLTTYAKNAANAPKLLEWFKNRSFEEDAEILGEFESFEIISVNQGGKAESKGSSPLLNQNIETISSAKSQASGSLSHFDIVKSFVNQEFGTIRILIKDEEVWFVGKDVAEILGYSNASKAVSTHVDSEDKQFLMIDIADSQNGNVPVGQSKTAFINESGLYSLILSSKLPSAKKFKRWVTSEVLPTIRKSGGYVASPRVMADTYFSTASYQQRELACLMFSQIEQQQQENLRLKDENQALADKENTWSDRNVLNALVRSLAHSNYSDNYKYAWNAFYRHLAYAEGIDVRIRKGHSKSSISMVDLINDGDEMNRAVRCAAAMCKNAGIDVGKVVNTTNAAKMDS